MCSKRARAPREEACMHSGEKPEFTWWNNRCRHSRREKKRVPVVQCLCVSALSAQLSTSLKVATRLAATAQAKGAGRGVDGLLSEQNVLCVESSRAINRTTAFLPVSFAVITLLQWNF